MVVLVHVFDTPSIDELPFAFLVSPRIQLVDCTLCKREGTNTETKTN